MSIQINPREAYRALDEREEAVDEQLEACNAFVESTKRELAFFDKHLDDGYDDAHDMTVTAAEVLDEVRDAIKAEYAQIDAERAALDNLLHFYGLTAADFDDTEGH